MKVLKVKGKNEQVILEQIKKQYGNDVIILSTKEEKANGIFKIFKKSKTVVTIAIDTDQDEASDQGTQSQMPNSDTYELLLDLKNQIDSMQQAIKEIKDLDSKDLSGKLVQKEESVLGILKDKLAQQGVSDEVLDVLLDGTKHVQDIEEIVRIIYANIEAIAGKFSKEDELPQIVLFVGATGVGKTTTIAKLTADYVLNHKKKVVLFTSDTYRIAAIDQLKTYADILSVPIEIIYSDQELKDYVDKWKHMDHIFIDTAGRSHKNKEQLDDIKKLLDSIPDKRVFLVVNANISVRDFKKVFDIYISLYEDLHLIITKIDETDEKGNILNIMNYARRSPSYITNGQDVPKDIMEFNLDQYTSELLGRIEHE